MKLARQLRERLREPFREPLRGPLQGDTCNPRGTAHWSCALSCPLELCTVELRTEAAYWMEPACWSLRAAACTLEPALWSCKRGLRIGTAHLELPAGPAYWSCLLVLWTGTRYWERYTRTARWNCAVGLRAGAAYYSCVLVLHTGALYLSYTAGLCLVAVERRAVNTGSAYWSLRTAAARCIWAPRHAHRNRAWCLRKRILCWKFAAWSCGLELRSGRLYTGADTGAA